ncbi:MAG TPA: hypothetical protein VN408_22210 [Actinoplanes sp.]|nr:hypothetical protein [Actinoplanes sp.]
MDESWDLLEGWDPVVVLAIRVIVFLVKVAIVGAVLYEVIKQAVCAGIKLAASDPRTFGRDPGES